MNLPSTLSHSKNMKCIFSEVILKFYIVSQWCAVVTCSNHVFLYSDPQSSRARVLLCRATPIGTLLWLYGMLWHYDSGPQTDQVLLMNVPAHPSGFMFQAKLRLTPATSQLEFNIFPSASRLFDEANLLTSTSYKP
jgi:hypothetical protein